MRDLHVDTIAATVRELCMDANVSLREDHLAALRAAVESERSPVGREVLCRLLENADVARTERVAFCQDTGYAVCFLDLGQDVHLVGGDLQGAVDRGVREGWRDGYLRASIVESPVRRRNTGDNTPAVVYVDIVPGESCRLTLLIKGPDATT